MLMKSHRKFVGASLVALGLLTLLGRPASVASDGDGNWPQFRGPKGLGISAAKGLPVTWSAEENLVWKAELPGAGASSPVVWGQHIFLTCYTGYGVPRQEAGSADQLQRHVLCLDRSTGRLRWDTPVPATLPEQEKIREDHGYASSTLAVDDERVYGFFGKSGARAFDHSGRQVWQADVGSGLSGWGSAASPVLHRNLAIVNASVESGALVALDRATGKEIWRAGGIKEAWNTPLLVNLPGGGTELVVGVIKQVLAFDPDTGKPLWHCDTGISWYMCPSAVAHEGVVYLIGGRSGGGLAVRAGARGNVTDTQVLWRLNKGSNVSSPVYRDGHLYFAHENLGVAYCVNAQTGALVYEERLDPPPGQIYASALLAQGCLYYVSRSGRTAVLAAQPTFEQLACNSLAPDRSAFNASPSVAGNHLLLRSDRFLYCLGQK
ncbi:MAG: serine/threonine protein kinase [Verrucomicrobia bacterium]|nr:serine/threonine protein kinase [Verrucomicrobiota bacterium]